MSDTAAHLVDRVLPVVPYRQWVMAYPRRLRWAFARDSQAAAESTRIFLREVFRWQRRTARSQGIKGAKVGAVSCTQRFGSRLDLNPHHHAVLPDGIFTVDDGGTVGFVPEAAPHLEDLQAILSRVVTKTQAMARRRGLLDAEPIDTLGQVQAEAVQARLPLSPLQTEEPRPTAAKLAVLQEGFSLEAGAHVHEHDRQGLEHLLRYALRPPVPLSRLRRLPDGRVELVLKRPLWDGTKAVAYTPRELLRRLAAIVPPPRQHSTRYFGVFAPSSKVRPKLVRGESSGHVGENKADAKAPSVAWGVAPIVALCAASPLPPPMPERPRRLEWSQLLARVFAADILECPKCGGRRRLKAFIPGGKMARKILDELGFHATAPPVAPARAPPRQETFDLLPDYSGVDEQYADSP